MPDISTPSAIWEEGQKKRKLPRALVGGTAAMIEAGTELTPQHEAEEDATYKARLRGTTLFNAYNTTIKKTVGKVFAKDISINADVPPVLQAYVPNFDGQGRNLTAFFNDVYRESLHDGVGFVYVDFPAVVREDGADPTLADQIAIRARPNAILYTAEQIISFKHEDRGGQEFLTELRIAINSVEQDPENKWGEILVEKIKLCRPGSVEMFRQVKVGALKSEWISEGEVKTSLSYIPIVPNYTNRTGYFTGEPVAMELAELNLEHWISSSEQRRALTFSRFPMTAVKGASEDSDVTMGPDQTLMLPVDGDAFILETTGKGIEAGRLDLEAIENKMQHAGMSIQVQNVNGNVTATAVNANSTEGNSAILATAGALEDTIDSVLQIFADYMGLPDGGSVTVNKDFGKVASNMSYDDMIKLHAAGGIIDDHFIWETMILRGDMQPNTDFEEIRRRIREASPFLMGGMPDIQDITPISETVKPESNAALEALLLKLSEPRVEDYSGLIEAIKSLPAPIVNITMPDAIPAPINITTPDVIFNAAPINITTPDININPANVSVTTPDVTVNAPDIVVNSPDINITTPDVIVNQAPITVNTPDVNPVINITNESLPANVTVNNIEKDKKTLKVTKRDKDGNIVEAVAE